MSFSLVCFSLRCPTDFFPLHIGSLLCLNHFNQMLFLFLFLFFKDGTFKCLRPSGGNIYAIRKSLISFVRKRTCGLMRELLGKPELRMVTLSNGSTLSLVKLVNHHGNTEDLVAGKLKSTAYKIKKICTTSTL